MSQPFFPAQWDSWIVILPYYVCSYGVYSHLNLSHTFPGCIMLLTKYQIFQFSAMNERKGILIRAILLLHNEFGMLQDRILTYNNVRMWQYWIVTHNWSEYGRIAYYIT